MENTSSKILSFEEFLNQGAPAEMPQMGDDANQVAEVPAEMPMADGDPAGDMPVVSDVELVDGPTAEMPEAPEAPAEEESQEDAQ
jgi:hypothetical protein